MQEQNPYSPPSANLIDNSPQASVLADRSQRFGAAVIDTLIGIALAVPTLYLLGMFAYARRGQRAPWYLSAAAIGIGFLGFILIHGYYLKRDGQTIGKKALGIRIVGLDGNVLPFGRLLALRYLPQHLIAIIPVIGTLYTTIEVLFVFRQDRRCLHDLIAGTKVVKAI